MKQLIITVDQLPNGTIKVEKSDTSETGSEVERNMVDLIVFRISDLMKELDSLCLPLKKGAD